MLRNTCWIPVLLLVGSIRALAFDPPVDEKDGVTLELAAPAEVGPGEDSVRIVARIRNERDEGFDGMLGLESLPEWIPEGETIRPVSVKAGSVLEETFVFRPGEATVDGLYPVHGRLAVGSADSADRISLHAIALVRCRRPARIRRPPRAVTVAARPEGAVDAAVRAFARNVEAGPSTEIEVRVGVLYDEEVLHLVVRVWDDVIAGDDLVSPDFRDSDYVRVYLGADPAPRDRETPLRDDDLVLAILPFGPDDRPRIRAVRYDGPRPDPPRGCRCECRTFREEGGYRLWLKVPWPLLGVRPAAGAELGFKVIVGDADEGSRERELVLGTRDGAYWRDAGAFELLRLGGATESAGVLASWESGCPDQPQPAPDVRSPETLELPPGDPAPAIEAARVALEERDPGPDVAGLWRRRILAGEEPIGIAVGPGTLGLVDGWIAVSAGNGRDLAIRGIRVRLETGAVGAEGGPRPAGTVEVQTRPDGSRTIRLPLLDRRGETWVSWRIDALEEGIRIAVSSGRRIVETRLGPADRVPYGVAAGDGNYILRPEAFVLNADGHSLSTRFVGVGYEGGIDLVSAVDLPLSRFVFDPAKRTATICVEGPATWTLVPGIRGPFEAAIRYRATTAGIEASPGVDRLRGRFVFDLWGGRPAEVREQLERALEYGLGRAVVVWHNWQRWGYDYRLPDVYPPNPKIGSVEDFRELVDFCDRNDLLFALHDNYIDIYPDSTGFSYDIVAFDARGRPQEAWYNRGRDAQSYLFRPDRFLPFLQRNIRRIREGIGPTAYFVDVFASRMPMGWFDREGAYHSQVETRDRWAEAFRVLRESLDGAPQISESGHDQLIGTLDGAQAQHLRVDASQPEWTWPIPCEAAARVPWIDLVWHDRFVLHGAGYPERFRGGLDRIDHGVGSDDYIATEILCGHPGMTDRAFGRNTVRHFWLTDPAARALGGASVREVRFDGGDLRRQIVTWEIPADGGGEIVTVAVNRDGARDWKTPTGDVLPPYGFAARGADWWSELVRRDGVIVESSGRPDGRIYVNARGRDPDPRFPIWIRARGLRATGAEGNGIALVLSFRVGRPMPAGFVPFVHVEAADPDSGRAGILFQLGAPGAPDSAEWPEKVLLTASGTVPDDVGPGRYRILAGMWNPETDRRLWPAGTSPQDRRIPLGEFRIDRGDGGRLRVSHWRPAGAGGVKARPIRWNRERKMIRFGDLRTNGAFLLAPPDSGDGVLRLTPLPGEPAFRVELPAGRLPGGVGPEGCRATAVFADPGRSPEDLPLAAEGGTVCLEVPAGVLRIELRPARK